MNDRARLRSRVAALARHRGRDDPEYLAAKQELDIQKLVDSAPPLTARQRSRLAVLLRGGERG